MFDIIRVDVFNVNYTFSLYFGMQIYEYLVKNETYSILPGQHLTYLTRLN